MIKKLFTILLSITLVLLFSASNIKVSKAESSESQIEKVSDEISTEILNKIFGDKVNTVNSSNEKYLPERDIIVTFNGNSLLENYLLNDDLEEKYENFSSYAISSDTNKILDGINKTQDDFIINLNKDKISYKLNYNYSSVINAVSIHVNSSDIAKIEKMDNVKNVIYCENYDIPQVDAVSNNVDVYSTGIYDTSNISYKGTGMVVAVLDTGLDYTHQAFQNNPTKTKLTYDNIDEVLDRLTCKKDILTSATADDLYISEKVPFAFDYADKDSDVFPTNSFHGTHVAGIIGGYDDTVTVDDNKCFANNQIFKGSAPDCQLAIFKVFSDFDTGAKTDDILAALADCAVLGVDVINMSLGSSAGYCREKDDSAINGIYDDIRSAGINLVVAASNSSSSALGGAYGTTNLTSNPDSGTVGTPSTYDAAISVASIDGQLSPYILFNNENAIYFANARSSSSKEYDFIQELLGEETEKTFNYVVIGGYGKDFNYTSSVKEKLAEGNTIAIVKRGDISFEEKQKIAASYGAVGCIIYNNVSGSISASLGNGYKIPTCTVSLDSGAKIITNQTGTLLISKENLAGPFMSDFSSWGPTPSLELKPEITAHGGNIVSAVVGGYDSFSGTSMAAPNLAGLVTLLRQYVTEKYGKQFNYDNCKIADFIYQLLMSTATIAYNEEGNPYSPRKQGAGLADIYAALTTDAYLYVKGSNKTKLSLGDDKEKTGMYTLRFNLNNMSNVDKTFIVNPLTFTETVSSDGITVAEKAHMFDDVKVSISSSSNNAVVKGNNVTVKANSDVELVVTLSLSRVDKSYLNANFVNGMYVEGFVKLVDTDLNGTDLSIPWLAFYGDWLAAPVFDASEYEVSADKFDDGVDDEDKLKAAVYATIPIARYYKGSEYYIPLGKYVFKVPEGTDEIQSTTDKVAITADSHGNYELYAVYAGLLRGAKYMQIEVVDTVTGEVIYSKQEENIRKSYGASAGSSYPSPTFLELSAYDLGLQNNTKYKVSLTAAIDYQDGEKCNNNTYEFYFYVDSEVPTIKSFSYRTNVLSNGEKHTYLDLQIYDNHYLQAVQLFSVVSSQGYASISLLGDYPTPVNSGRNSTTKVTFEITDYLSSFKSSNSDYNDKIGVYLYDYALNSGGFLIPIDYKDVDGIEIEDKDGNSLSDQPLEMAVGDIKEINIILNGENNPLIDDVDIKVDKSKVVEIKDGVVLAKGEGNATVTITSKTDVNVKQSFKVIVRKRTEEDGDTPEYKLQKLKINSYYDFSKGVRVGLQKNVISTDCGNELHLGYECTPWYATNVEVTWKSLNEDVAVVDKLGYVKTIGEGTATIWAQCLVGKLKLTTSVTIIVGKEYEVLSGYLYEYNGYCGTDGFLQIPNNLGAIYIGSYNDNNPGPFYQNTDLKTVIIPEGIESIGHYSFAFCSNLETVYLPSTLKSIGNSAFRGCYNLKNVYYITGGTYNPETKVYDDFTYQEECNVKNLVIGENAFSLCSKLSSFDLSKTTAVYAYAFYNCISLEKIDISNVKCMGSMAFAFNSNLTEVITSPNTKFSKYLFWYCTNLKSLDIYGDYVYNNMLLSCKSLEKVVIHDDVKQIQSRAFADCTSLSSVIFEKDCEEILYRAFENCTSLSTFELPNGLHTLGQEVFKDDTMLVSVSLAYSVHLTKIDGSPFSGCNSLVSFNLPNGSRFYKTQSIKGSDGKNYKFLYEKNTNNLVFAPTACPQDKNTYNFYDENGNLYSDTIGDYAFANSVKANAPTEDFVLVIPEGIKVIGDGAFMNNSFTKVILPTTLEYLGASAFSGCIYLKQVIIQSNLTEINEKTFYNCKALTAFEIPASVEVIGPSAFRMCSSLSSIIIPANVRVIDEWAFATDVLLTNVTFEENSHLQTIGERAFTNNYILEKLSLPEGLETIGSYAFANNYGLKELYICGTISKFGEYVFGNCQSLTDVVMGEGLKVIGNCCFVFYQSTSLYYNTVLKNVKLPSTLEAIGYYAFAGCTNLVELDLSNVKYIFGYAFLLCNSLEKVTLGADVKYIGQNAFFRCTNLKDINLNGVERIDSQAFYECSSLENGDFDNLIEVGPQAFYHCEKLKYAKMPKVELISALAFMNCTSITSIDISNVKVMGQAAFFNNIALEEVTIPSSCESIYSSVFTGCSKLEKISVDENNKVFFVDENGVLYKKLTNGMYQLMQYPTGSKLKNYTIITNTVRVDDYAFAFAMSLNSVVINEEMKSIGNAAFYGCGLETGQFNYIFKCQYAPRLEGTYSNSTSFINLYANYSYKIGYIQMDLTIPNNGLGYDGYIYDLFFKDPVYSEAVMEEDTKVVYDNIEYLATLTSFTKEDIDLFYKTKELFSYLSKEQKALVVNSYKLIDIYDQILLAGESTNAESSNSEKNNDEIDHTTVNGDEENNENNSANGTNSINDNNDLQINFFTSSNKINNIIKTIFTILVPINIMIIIKKRYTI